MYRLKYEVYSQVNIYFWVIKYGFVLRYNIKAPDSYSRDFTQNKLHWNNKTGVNYNDFMNSYFLWSYKLTASYWHNMLYLLDKLLHVSAIYPGHVPRFTSLVTLFNCTIYMATKLVTPWGWPGHIAEKCRSFYSKYKTLCN